MLHAVDQSLFTWHGFSSIVKLQISLYWETACFYDLLKHPFLVTSNADFLCYLCWFCSTDLHSLGQDGCTFHWCSAPVVSKGHWNVHGVHGTHQFYFRHYHISDNVVLLWMPNRCSCLRVSNCLVHWGFNYPNACYPHASHREDSIHPGHCCTTCVDPHHNYCWHWDCNPLDTHWKSRTYDPPACFLLWICCLVCTVLLHPCPVCQISLHQEVQELVVGGSDVIELSLQVIH